MKNDNIGFVKTKTMLSKISKYNTSLISGKKPTNFTIICPVHNEATMLKYTIKSVFELGPDEVLWALDRCTDASEKIIRQWGGEVIKYSEADGAGWRFRAAYLRRDLYEKARYDCILNTSADIRLDPTIGSHLNLISSNRYGLLSFHYYEPWNIQSFERALITKIKPGFAGLLAFSKKAWYETEDLEDLKKISRGEDTHLHLAIKSKYPTKHIHSHSLHLRPNERKEDHYNRGIAMFQQLHRGPIWAFLHSLVMVRPAVFAGWYHAYSTKDQL